MPEQLIGSPSQHMLAINNSGAAAIGAYSGGTIYPLLVNTAGELLTSPNYTIGSLVIGSVSANVDSIYVQSGANIDLGSAWTTVGSVYVSNIVPISGALDININNPSTIGSYPIQTVDATDLDIRDLTSVSDSVTATISSPSTIGSYTDQNVTINSPSTIGSYTTQTIDGTVTVTDIANAGSLAIQTVDAIDLDIRDLSSVSDSVTATISSPSTIGSYTTQTVDGTVTVTDIANAGSLAVQTVDATNLDIRDLTYISDSVEVYQGTDPWIILGSTNVTNFSDLGSTVVVDSPSTIGSLAIQTIGGTVAISTDPVPVSGIVGVEFSSDYVNVIQSGNEWEVSGVMSVDVNDASEIGSYTTQTVDGTVTVNNLATAGSLAIQTVDGTVIVTDIATAGSLAIQTVDGTVSVTDIATAGSLAVQTVDGTVSVDVNDASTIGSYTTQTVDGTVIVTDIAIAGSLAVQTIDGDVTVSTDPLPVSGAYFPGSVVGLESLPTDSNMNNPSYEFYWMASGTATGVTGSAIGSIWQTIGIGSYAQKLTWSGDRIITIGGWGT